MAVRRAERRRARRLRPDPARHLRPRRDRRPAGPLEARRVRRLDEARAAPPGRRAAGRARRTRSRPRVTTGTRSSRRHARTWTQIDVPVRLGRSRRTRTASRGSSPRPTRCPPLPDDGGRPRRRSPRRRRCTTRSPASAGTRSRSRLGSARPKSAAMLEPAVGRRSSLARPLQGADVSSSRSKRWPTAWRSGPDMVARHRHEHGRPDTRDPPEDWPIVEVTGTFDHPAARQNRLQLRGL